MSQPWDEAEDVGGIAEKQKKGEVSEIIQVLDPALPDTLEAFRCMSQ